MQIRYLNSTKTEIIFFRKKGTNIPQHSIKINGIKITKSANVKYVGIIFDEHLTFDRHREILHAKLKRANNLIAIARHHLPKNLLLQVYYSQFYSRLTYGCQLWGLKEIENTKIQTLQKKAVRLLSFSHFQAHTHPIFKELKLLKLSDIVEIYNILFVHNVLNNKAPDHFQNYFKMHEKEHNHNTVNNPRSMYSTKGKLELPQIKTCNGQQTIKYACARSWNNFVTESVRNNNTANDIDWLTKLKVSNLKHLLKTHFLKK